MYGGYVMRPLGRGVKSLLLANIVVFVLSFLLVHSLAVSPQHKRLIVDVFGLRREAVLHGMFWQPFSYMFLHGGFFHILANMLGLYFLGPEVESAMGTRRFVRFYLLCGVIAGIAWMIISGGSERVCVGASGAVYGVVAAFAGLYPQRRLTMLVYFVLPISMTAMTLLLVLVGASIFMTLVGGGDVAHVAHLAGAAVGYFYGSSLRGRQGYGAWGTPGRRARGNLFSELRAWYRRKQFKVMTDNETPIDWAAVDAILDKIQYHGVGSLTPDEKKLLDRASREQR
jgi:membrane associated rhomboid family serine protease